MIPMNVNQERALMEENRRRLMRSLKMHQLYLQADAERPQFGERLLALLGDLMIAGGEKLKSRHSVSYTMEPQKG